jgi:hypothetical protein
MSTSIPTIYFPAEVIIDGVKYVPASMIENAQPEPEGRWRGLVADLRSTASGLESQSCPQTAALITRAADLLQRHQPVAVSKRLPGPEDCDAEGRCWWYGEGGDMVGWTLDAEGPSYYRAKYWLPARALPVPPND